MRPIEELDHYDMLELPRGADEAQVEKAYRTLSATYAPDSLAIYSIVDPQEAEFIRDRIEQAYCVLSDEEKRHHYDVFLVQGVPPGPDGEIDEFSKGTPPSDVNTLAPPDDVEIPQDEKSDSLAESADEGTDWNGARLRLARLRKGLEIDQLASLTKISPNYLRCIEEERYEELPAMVYVRGFVASSARALGLDSDEVVAHYVAHFEAARSGPPRSRFLGRK